ncbi:MAG: hypothetical protein IPP48_08245 [Chitinophagaceae bacterium]|nr:hypothetical protein [Chitinophagaceae bacterium]
MKDKLAAITKIIIDPTLNYSTLRDGCNALMDFFYKAVSFEETAITNKHVYTQTGLAVSPYSAAFCIIDILRTRNFLLAVKTAIEDKLKAQPNKPVVILYAGTGPFATLVTPLTTLFSPKQLRLVLMDINEHSIGYLKKIITVLNIEKYVVDIIKADAAVHKIEECHQPDILLSETMKPGLDKEPQVSIITNLLPQCKQNVILMPQSISIELVLKGNRANNKNEICCLAKLLTFDADMAIKLATQTENIPIFSSGITITIPPPTSSSFTELVLETQIQLYGNNYLNRNETSLTIPLKIASTTDFEYPTTFNVKYKMDKTPGFVFTHIE